MRSILVEVLAVVCLVSAVEAYYDRAKFKEICENDNSNDDAIHMDAQQLLVRSGFKYEDYYSVGDNGYVTNLIRIVNPAVKRENLRGPPVVIFHGANIDQTAYLMSSSKQHHPEPYPLPQGYASVHAMDRSYNRSLGFTLANRGFDVWLVGTRGSNVKNSAHTVDVAGARSQGLSFRPSEEMFTYYKSHKYWLWGIDDLIQYDIKNQLDLIKEVTESKELSIFSFSISTVTTMAFLAQNEDYARNTRVYFQSGPAIAVDHNTFLDWFYFEKLCPLFPTRGVGFTPTFWIKPAVRKFIIKASESKTIRYSAIYEFVRNFFGKLQKYMTNLERNVLAHVFQPVAFKLFKQYCQNSLTKKTQYFDYGKKKNTELYNRPDPPSYDVSRIHVQNWVVISGTQDGLADDTSIQRLVETSKSDKPVEQIICPGFSHLDLLAAVEVDKYVNLPVVEILNKYYGN